MENLLLMLMNLSLTAGWLILMVVLLRLIFKKAPKWIHCLLWGLVALRLLCPFTLESKLSLIPTAEPLPQDIFYTATPSIDSGIPAIDEAVNPKLEESLTPMDGASANPTQIWGFLLTCQWLTGLSLMLLYAAFSYIHLRLRLRTATRLQDNIFQSENAPSPFVLGFFLPRIYLPYALLEDDMPYVIAHEKAHIRRKDHWWKPLAFLLLAIYWFHPLVWLAYILFCRDMEAACDEAVIGKLSPDGRKEYSLALLHCSLGRKHLTACPLAFGEVGVKGRIKGVMSYKKPALWISIAAVLLGIIAAVCFLTQSPDEPSFDLPSPDELGEPVCMLTPVDLSREHTLEEVKNGFFVVFEDGDITSGQKYWDEFLEKCQAGEGATVYLANYYTLDQDRVAPEYYEANKDRYPLLFVEELTFDGAYHLRWSAYGKEYTDTYQYLRKFEEPATYENAGYSSVLRYVITDDFHATWDDLWRSVASSAYNVAIPYNTVYTNYLP